MVLQGIRTSLTKKFYIFVIFPGAGAGGGGGGGVRSPFGSAHVLVVVGMISL